MDNHVYFHVQIHIHIIFCFSKLSAFIIEVCNLSFARFSNSVSILKCLNIRFKCQVQQQQKHSLSWFWIFIKLFFEFLNSSTISKHPVRTLPTHFWTLDKIISETNMIAKSCYEKHETSWKKLARRMPF